MLTLYSHLAKNRLSHLKHRGFVSQSKDRRFGSRFVKYMVLFPFQTFMAKSKGSFYSTTQNQFELLIDCARLEKYAILMV